eukprot:390013-Pleurochrysis_carterae.AAC.2
MPCSPIRELFERQATNIPVVELRHILRANTGQFAVDVSNARSLLQPPTSARDEAAAYARRTPVPGGSQQYFLKR